MSADGIIIGRRGVGSEIVISNTGTAAVNDVITILPSTISENGHELIIPDVPDFMVADSLFFSIENNEGQKVKINDYSLEHKKTIKDTLPAFYDKEVKITDLNPTLDKRIIVVGTLKHSYGNNIIVNDKNNRVILTKFDNNSSISVGENDVQFNVFNPYISATIFGSMTKKLNINAMYDCSRIYYSINYMFLLTKLKENTTKLQKPDSLRSINLGIDGDEGEISNDRMKIVIKATIKNNTSAVFSNTKITLVEKFIEPPKVKSNYFLNKAPRQQYKKSTSRNYQQHPEAASSRSINFEDSAEDKSQQQKTHRINNPVDLDPYSSRSVTIFEASDIKSNLEYIYTPQQDDKKVNVSLLWKNTKENHKRLGISLPLGNARVLRRQGSLTSTPIKLADVDITREHSKEVVRMDLGPASMITAEYEKIGTSIVKTQGYTIEKFKIRIKNRMSEDINIKVVYIFPKVGWEITKQSDLKFKVWVPDNDNESISNKIGEAIAAVKKIEEKEFILEYKNFN